MVHSALFPEGSCLGMLYKEGHLGSPEALGGPSGREMAGSAAPPHPATNSNMC